MPDAALAAAPRWVVFACDGYRFAIPLWRVREIVTPRPFTRLPGCGPAVCGLVGLRGRVITVLDFGAALALRPSGGMADHRLLLLEWEERWVGLAVDAVLAVASAEADLPIGAETLRALDIEQEHVLGIGTFAEQPFLAVDPDRLLARLLG